MKYELDDLYRAHCVSCSWEGFLEPRLMVCPDCGSNLDLLVDFARTRPDRGALPADPDFHLGRYFDFLPLPGLAAASPGIGGTPLLAAPRLGEYLDCPRLHLKDETRNLSGSLKDRASLAVLLAARAEGAHTVATASTGNAAASLAALAPRLEAEAIVFAPAGAPAAKLRQVQVHGARLFRVDGNYDRAFDLCREACERFAWTNRSTGINPWCSEGKKTVALEIADQLGWAAPDAVLVPVGDGSIIGGLHKGFVELLELGWIDRMPRLLAVQAEGSAAVTDAWREDREIRPVKADTLADSIAVDLPRDGGKALRAIRQSDGAAIAVSDGEILQAALDLARREGLWAEPAGAASVAGLRKAREAGLLDRDERVVAMVTGHGLKDRDAPAALLEEAPLIASLEDLP